jgi:hypothetical protein
MTYGEFFLLRAFRNAERFADLPNEVIKMIIRFLNLKGRVAYNQRRRLPRFSWLRGFTDFITYSEQHYLWSIGVGPYPGPEQKSMPYLGPGF